MTFSAVLGSTNISDGTNYVIESESIGQGTNPATWRQTDGTLVIPVLILGSNQDDIEGKRRAIIGELNAAERSWRYGRESERIALALQMNTADTVYFDVRGGRVDPIQWHYTGKIGRVVLTLICDSHNGRSVARLDADVRPVSGTLTNGSATYLLDDVRGDYPARTRIRIVDQSVTGAINRLRLSLRSAASAVVGDWDPWIDIVNAGSVNQSDATAFGNSYERVTLPSATDRTFIGRATILPGALNKGPFNLRFRMRDNATVIGQPTGFTATPVGINVSQSAIATDAASGTSIAPTWSSATTTGSSLVAVVKASKTMVIRGITTIENDAVNVGETIITLTANHGYTNGTRVLISDVVDNTPNINGVWIISRVSGASFNITTGTTTPGTGGSARATFFETVNSVPSGYIKIGEGTTVEQLVEGVPLRSHLPPEPDTFEQSKVWIYTRLASASESGSKSFGFDVAVSNRSAILAEVVNVPSNGGLGAVTVEGGEGILNPPSGGTNAMYLGIAASKDQTWQPTLGFTEQRDGGGLVLASRFVADGSSQPWVAIPDDYDFPLLHALVSFSTVEQFFDLDAGTYAVRVQAVNNAGDEGRATNSASPVIPHDGGGLLLSWTAPSATGISHYRITVQDPDGAIWQADTADSSTSYMVTSLDGWEQVSALPGTLAGDYTASPAIVLVTVGTDDMTASTTTPLLNYEQVGVFRTEVDNLGAWHLAPREGIWAQLPPQEQMADGSQPDWAVEVFATNAGGPSATIDIDALNLISDESGITLWLPGMDLTTPRTWVVETRRDGSVVAWLEDGSGGFVGQVATSGRGLLPSAGDNVVSIVADQADGVSVIDNAQFTVAFTLFPVADWAV